MSHQVTDNTMALNFAEQIEGFSKLKQTLPQSTGDELSDISLDELPELLDKIIQQLNDWPAELITSKLQGSFNLLTSKTSLYTAEELAYTAVYRIERLIETVLPVLSSGDGLEARLKIAEELTSRLCADCEGGFGSSAIGLSDYITAEVWLNLIFGLAIKDSRKWSIHLTDKIKQTCKNYGQERRLQRDYFDAVRHEESNRIKLNIDPDIGLSKEFLLERFDAMKEANPNAHANTIAAWKRAANSLYLLVP